MGTDKTSIGDRLKGYEDDTRFMPMLPIVARLDGRAFHTFCRGLRKPYDERLHRLMVAVTTYLVEETQAMLGYTQSDEITLVWYTDDLHSQIFFDGRVQKMVSTLSALATLKFNRLLPSSLPEKAHLEPTFDCRVFQVPNQEEAANCFLWRERDATKNSISAAGQAQFSHKELHGKNGSEVQELLFTQKGINWNDYPAWAKRGTWVQKRRVSRPFSATEISKLPAKHAARMNPDLVVERWEIQEPEIPPFGTVTNRTGVVFRGEIPITSEGQH
jgi:tRNA(His) guanylyltransferase